MPFIIDQTLDPRPHLLRLRCMPRSYATYDIGVLHPVLSHSIVETELGPSMILCQASDEWSARQPTKTRELRADTWIDML